MSFSIGETVGRYRITNQLGQGGMATVYKAYDANLDRYVAIKVMHQAFKEDPSFLARFQREAQIVAKLRHPHIVNIHEFAEHEHQPYLVMEFIEGETLKARLNESPLSLAETVAVIKAVGEALTYAHDQGVLHRDIKPSNILMDTNDRPYLTDFGLARMVQAGESTLSKDMLLGTPQYISPEQAQGIRELGPETDIYSLGIVLYQLVVGRVPYSADTPYAIVHDHIYKPLPMPSQINPTVPPEVERVLLKALAKDSADRYQKATNMVMAFEDAVKESQLEELSPQSIVAASIPVEPPVSSPAPAIPAATPSTPTGTASMSSIEAKLKRNRTLWMLGGLGAFVCVCLLGLFVAVAAIADPELRDNPHAMQMLNETPPPPQPGNVEIPRLSVDEALQMVDTNPNDPVAQFALALAYLNDNQRASAQEALRHGLELSADQPEVLGAAAQQIAEQGYLFEAITLFVQAMEGNDNPTIRNYAGALTYRVAQDANRAQIAALRRVVENNPDSAGAYAILGRAQLSLNQLTQAESAISHAMELDGSLPEVHLILGELYAAQGAPSDAQTEWRFAQTAARAPQWVIERANELLGTNNN